MRKPMMIPQKPLHIGKAMAGILLRRKLEKRPRERIALVGIELEGGWSKLPEGVREIIRDSSVRFQEQGGMPPQPPTPNPLTMNANTYEQALRTWRNYQDMAARAMRGLGGSTTSTSSIPHIGELPSSPMTPEKVPLWIKHSYPQHVNETCGLHVHMSFKEGPRKVNGGNLYYQKLMIPEYPATIMAGLMSWAEHEGLPKKHPLWDRLKGKSTYCQPLFQPDQQVLRSSKAYNHHEDGHRYTVINYCFNTHGTLECRVLPMMETADQAVRAVQAVLDITNACLIVLKQREERLSGALLVDPSIDTIREEREEMI